MTFSESTLIQGILNNDRKAFEIMYDAYFPKIYGYSFHHVGKNRDAEQLTEEIFSEMIRTLDQYHGAFSLMQWIFNIARRHVDRFKFQNKLHTRDITLNSNKEFIDFFKIEEALLKNQSLERF